LFLFFVLFLFIDYFSYWEDSSVIDAASVFAGIVHVFIYQRPFTSAFGVVTLDTVTSFNNTN